MNGRQRPCCRTRDYMCLVIFGFIGTVIFAIKHVPNDDNEYVYRTRHLSSFENNSTIEESNDTMIHLSESEYKSNCISGLLLDGAIDSDATIVEVDLHELTFVRYPRKCPYNCNGNGVCHRGACVCFPGFSGTVCGDIDRCYNVNCTENGYCNDNTGKCVCNPGFAGEHCEYTDCNGNGVYEPLFGKCNCMHGFTGDECDQCTTHPTGYNHLTYLCCKDQENGQLTLITVPNAKVDRYITGNIFKDPCIIPSRLRSYDPLVDCACRPKDDEIGTMIAREVQFSMDGQSSPISLQVNPMIIGDLIESEANALSANNVCLCDEYSETGLAVLIVIISIISLSAIATIIWFVYSCTKVPSTGSKPAKSVAIKKKYSK